MRLSVAPRGNELVAAVKADRSGTRANRSARGSPLPRGFRFRFIRSPVVSYRRSPFFGRVREDGPRRARHHTGARAWGGLPAGSRAVATPLRVGDDVAMLRVHGVHGGEERGTCPAHRRRARFEMRHVRWSACRPGPPLEEGKEHRRVVAREAKSRDVTRHKRPRTRPVHAKAPPALTALPPLGSQALVNCGHVYHLSCIHRWFNCKKDASARGGRRANAPPHAPCPKCKEPFDMGSTVTIYLDLVKGAAAPNSAAKPKRRAAHHQRLASASRTTRTIREEFPNRRLFTSRRRTSADRREREPTQNTRERSEFFFKRRFGH